MTGLDDPFERLRAADPTRSADPVSAEVDRERIFRQVVTSTRPNPLRALGRRRILVLVGAVFLVAAAYVMFRPVTEPLTVACYGAANLDADIVVVDAPTGGDPVDACRPLWGPDGELGAQFGGSATPDLQACVLESGAVGVFPTASGSQVCTDLGLAVPASDSNGENQAVIGLRDELVDAFLEQCLDVDEARAKVEEALARHGLEGWQVTVTQTFTEERPCASLAFDVPAKTIELVPVSR
jgi:hypothetical protein